MDRQELFIGGLPVDLGDGIPMPKTYQIADIKEPSKRNSNYSKTLKLPGTKRNIERFTGIWQISKEVQSLDLSTNFNPDFNPNLKVEAVILSNHFTQMKGFARLRSITIENYKGDRKLFFNVEVYGNIANIFQDLGKLKLNELDLSEYDHPFTKANQVNSWDTSIIKDGAPFVNFAGAAELGFANGAPTGEGYVYPLINYGLTDLFTYNVRKLYPAVYCKTLIDKIFEATGFTYTSNFFSSSMFKKLVSPFDGNIVELTPTQIANRKFRAELTSQLNETTDLEYIVPVGFPPDQGSHQGSEEIEPVVFDDDSTGANFDTGNNYDNLLGTYTVPANGRYKFDVQADMTWTVNPPVGTGATNGSFSAELLVINQTTGLTLGSDVYVDSATGSQTLNVSSGSFDLDQGDVIVVRARLVSNGIRFLTGIGGTVITDPASIDWTVESGATFENTVVQIAVQEGDTMILNSVVPDIEAKDWFTGIIKMFNLYVDIDPQDERNLIIEPLVDFYDGNDTIDWTGKLDTDRPVVIKTVSEIDAREYVFTHKLDKDFDNTRYTETNTGEIYGQYIKEVKNDFVKKTQTFELPFGAPVMVGNLINDIVVMRVAQETPVGSGTLKSVKGLPRILHYSGLLDAGGSWTHDSDLVPDTNETTYPYAGHLDHPETPTLDLLFGTPEEVYFGTPTGIGSNYTNNNLFNAYYKQFIEEITSKDSKIVEAYFYLTPKDIFELDFSNFIFVDGAVYRLNKIVDYDSSKRVSTKVELSKLITGTPFVPDVLQDWGGEGRRSSEAGTLDGGKDAVKDIYKLTSYVKVDGGEDEVLSLKQTGNERIIDGGKL